jgi:hypothetical protein
MLMRRLVHICLAKVFEKFCSLLTSHFLKPHVTSFREIAGRAIYLRHGDFKLSYNTFNQNVAGDIGGAVYAIESPIE